MPQGDVTQQREMPRDRPRDGLVELVLAEETPGEVTAGVAQPAHGEAKEDEARSLDARLAAQEAHRAEARAEVERSERGRAHAQACGRHVAEAREREGDGEE